ncbi:hypothetical protein [Aquicoccus sp. SU-CL01552]|uniref:hypothetical protein n=1 Tax=Aquicoccus sp. SU-CL01552 TaxID=3127656 RepID=UPI003104119B
MPSSSFLQSLADELYSLNEGSFVRDIDLVLNPDAPEAKAYELVTPQIALGFPEHSPSRTSFLSNEGNALVIDADETVSGANWMALEMPVRPKGPRCVLAVRFDVEADRSIYPEVFVRNKYSGTDYKPNRVAVFSPKFSSTFLLINIHGDDLLAPHSLNVLFNCGPFRLEISRIRYVSL